MSKIQQLSHSARQAVPAKNWSHVKTCAREILNRQRDSAEGRFLLGLGENGLGRYEQATRAFEAALRLDDSRYDAGVELAEQYVYANRFGDAVALLARFEAGMDKSPLYLDKAARLYINVGLPDRAWPLLNRAVELQPEADSLRAHLAECAVFVGEIDTARKIYTELIEKYPTHQRNHYELSRLSRATDTAHVDAMQAILKGSNLPPERNVYLYYALGKELEDLERWDEAFGYYKQAGDAARSQADYDVRSDVAIIESVIEVCDRDWLAKDAAPDASRQTGGTPVFIVGLPRSGTTLTERIVSSHSQVESAGETFFLRDAVRAASGLRTDDLMSPDIITAAARKDVGRIAGRYLDSVAYKLAKLPFFIEKYPENFLYLGFIARAFPDARIVLQTRHAMDACFAMYKQSYFRYAYALEDLAEYYIAYHRLTTHWRELLGEALIEVNYESMVSDSERETRRLLDALGLDFEEACLHFERNVTASNTASTVQIREKAHTRSVRRWQRFEEQLQPLRERLERAGVEIE